ncbi:conserved hypothetical protein [Mucor ambiguus]|uniref:STB6-like N-terminal domain-containing protein n=1 Tax=Mucor ambiguus TaxID=91626 RepID=A0A0C9MPT9_9FUNG|nr:conserved hypothetical protein [Mucor ambiguus]
MAATCGLSVIEEQQELRGYQIYIVEQWVCDRSVDSNVVKVFTGDENHIIQVAVIAISTAELQHPRPQIQTFLNVGAHLKSKPTPLGEILLTNPGELPFDMDMVLIRDGDYDKWVNQAYVNINLRRTNCTGRSSLNLRPPNPASEEKFRSLYKIADTVHFQDAVINLVSLVQIALYLFKLLDKDYIDGLICNETTNALWTFYTKYDPIKTTEFTLKEPWMEPHLVAAIISKLLMCRNKLQDYNFTTLKDPFADYDTFRFDIGDYQRYKNIKVTKFIDLETLGKLNEHAFSQLKMRKVIKSKLDDISGITNSPLFNETSDPEVFRHHSTIESLRAIWRPKLKGGVLHNSTTTGSATDQQPNELMHMLKRTTRTGGAAVDMLSRVAGSIPWINTTTDNNKRDSHTSRSPTATTASPLAAQFSDNIVLSPSPLNQSRVESNVSQSHIFSSNSSPQQPLDDEYNIVSRIATPTGKPSPLSIQTSTSSNNTPPVTYANTPTHTLNNTNNSTPIATAPNTTSHSPAPANTDDIPNSDIKRVISPDHLDQDIPSYVQSVPPLSAASTAVVTLSSPPTPSVPKLRISKSTDTTTTSTPRSTTPSSSASIKQQTKEEGDFVPYIVPPKNQTKHPTIRHARSVSDSILLDAIFIHALKENNKLQSLRSAFGSYTPTRQSLDRYHRRSQTTSALPSSSKDTASSITSGTDQEQEISTRPTATINVQTYMIYERLCQKQRVLQRTYEEIKTMANLYERTAAHLKETYEKRSLDFDVIQKDSRQVMDEQNEAERRLKDVEDNSAKLHYELKVLNDKLKDIEDNVGTFYGKVGLLERKMDDSQQSITTMLIIGNYFNHYWIKIRQWISWLSDAPHKGQNKQQPQQTETASPSSPPT